MAPYRVTTFDSRGLFDSRGCGDPYHVVVHDGSDQPVIDMGALSLAHARKVADSLALLLKKLRPGREIVLSVGEAFAD